MGTTDKFNTKGSKQTRGANIFATGAPVWNPNTGVQNIFVPKLQGTNQQSQKVTNKGAILAISSKKDFSVSSSPDEARQQYQYGPYAKPQAKPQIKTLQTPGSGNSVANAHLQSLSGGITNLNASRTETKDLVTGAKKEREKKRQQKAAAEAAKKQGENKLPPPSVYEYNWNLPPHKWSLPVEPEIVNNLGGGHLDYGVRGLTNDAYRRGRLWWKANADLTVVDQDKKSSALTAGSEGRLYGFQFLWNPETVGTSVAVQMEATPTVQDRFLGVAGAFPATETISFNIRLDRTNDFACGMAGMPRPRLEDPLAQLRQFEREIDSGVDAFVALDNAWRGSITKDLVLDFVKYYQSTSGFISSDEDIKTKLVDLFTRGTIADIEYLYRAINGKGPGGKKNWINGRGQKTADIGFLMPTLLHIDIGPLSYQGYVTSLSVNHIAFTKDMVPFRTDVSISCNVLATAGLSSTIAEQGAK